jgi:hypothetical protein
MTSRPSTIERAYQLARTGEYASVSDLKKQLSRESYGDAEAQLYGPMIKSELQKLMKAAHAATHAPQHED